MAVRIKLEKSKLAEISGSGLILEVTQDERNRVLVRVESEIGGRRIIIKQHEDDAQCIVYSLEQPPEGPNLRIVK